MPRYLSPGQRIFFLSVNVVLGLIPSLAFFAWVERNASLPWIAVEWGWPWIGLPSWPTVALAAWDFTLVLLFGLIHSWTAQPAFHRALSRIVPAQAVRTIYLAGTGLSLLALMGLWQNTGIVLWAPAFGTKATLALSLAVFWSLMATAGWIMSRLGPGRFLGLETLYLRSDELSRTEGTPVLRTEGLYGRVRHPIYTLTLLAFVAAPWMTLDRLIIAVATALYLKFAIPIEERKLVAIFGPAYEEYRRKVPAVVPRAREGARTDPSGSG